MVTDDDREWALMRSPAFTKELAEVREVGQRVALYSQLRYLAAEEGWKPGWAAHFYKSLHGDWPDRDWERVPPMRPPQEVYQMVQRRQRSYRNAMKQHFEERRAEDERRVENGDVADALHEGGEGNGGVCDDRPMSGVEEQDECSGELRETGE